jgi:hypothetical protein
MKRLAVLCIVLLALTSLAFAEVKIEPKVTLAASGTLSWGIDLSTFDTGFNNAADADLTVTFIAADTAETKKGEGAAYGEIKISDIEFIFGGDDLGNTADAAAVIAWLSDWLVDTDVAAKIVVPPIEIGVYAAPTLYTDSIGEIEVDANDDNIVDIEATYYGGGAGAAVQPFTTTYGTWVKATLGPLALTVKLVSNGDWTGTVDTEYNQYAVGLDGVLTVTPLTVSFGAYEDWVASETGLYGKVAATAGPIAFWAGIEANLAGGAFMFVTGGSATLTIAEGSTVAITALYGEPINGLDLKFAFVEPEAGLIPALDLGVTFYLLDVGDDTMSMEYEAIVTAGYKVMMGDVNYVRPYGTFKYGAGNSVDDVSATADYTNYTYAEAGVQFKLIPLTLFTVKYVSGDLAADGAFVSDTGSVQFVAAVTY